VYSLTVACVEDTRNIHKFKPKTQTKYASGKTRLDTEWMIRRST